jgi:cytochrome P450
VSSFESVDFFTDQSLIADPYPYIQELVGQCPVVREPFHDVVIVSGYDETVAVYRDTETFSSCNTVGGPFPRFPGPVVGDDISESIERHRHQLPMSQHLVTMDPPEHTKHRGLLMRLLTPKRLKQNEDYMWRLADQQLDQFIMDGSCEVISQFSKPFSMLVIADLLGVPESDHDHFREHLLHGPTAGAITDHRRPPGNWLEWLDRWFNEYVEERRHNPRDDILSELALGRFPDGSTPEIGDVVRIATFLFAAGQETTARLIGEMVKFLAVDQELQKTLRERPELRSGFIEETLRMESPTKSDFRLARRSTTLGGVDVPAGTTVMMLLAAANRDPRRFECPAAFDIERQNVQAHIAFGRGRHSCPGGPLARAEAAVSLDRILARMQDIRLSPGHHGPPGAPHFDYEPSYILRSIESVHIQFTPTDPAD